MAPRNLLSKGTSVLTREMEQNRLFDEAMSILRDVFKPYEGAKPNVPQPVFQRAPTGKQQVDPVVQRAINDPGVKAKMTDALIAGLPLKDWYNMEPTRLLWNDITGPSVGTQRFNRMQDYMGPTSILSKVDPNIGNATRWNYYDMNQMPAEEQLTTILNAKGKPQEKLNPPPPPGYGGAGQINQFKVANEMLLTGQPQDPLDYLKTARYSGALKGNLANLPVDRHAVRGPLMLLGDPEGLSTSVKLGKGEPAFNAQERFQQMIKNEPGTTLSDLPVTWWKDVPRNPAEYYALEDYYKMLAKEAGIDPAEAQASTWVGNAGLTGVESDPSLTAQGLFNRRVANQAVARNMDPRDLLTRMMTGQGYLGLAGAGLVGSEFLPGGDQR